VHPAAFGQHPAVTAGTFMISRPDSGGNGNWATDLFIRSATIGPQTTVRPFHCGETTGPCYEIARASITDSDGTFITLPGAYTPNQGAPYTGQRIRGVVQGQMSGTGSFGTFYATALPSASRVPTINFGSANPSYLWPQLFFPPNTVLTGLNESTYSYRYASNGEHWTDSSTDSSGQVAAAGNITGISF
jgi:hypothetical protein